MSRRHKTPLVDRLGGAAIGLVAGFALLLLVAPSLIVIAISFEPRAFISFPPSGFSLRWYAAVFENRQLTDSILVSLRISLWVMAACLVLGVPAAFASVRGTFPGKAAAGAFLLFVLAVTMGFSAWRSADTTANAA